MEKKFFKYIATKITLIIAIVFSISSCSDEYGGPSVITQDSEIMLALSLKLPANPTTRSLTSNNEEEVRNLSVLAFHKNESGQMIYHYTAYADAPTSTNTFTVKLIKGQYELLVLGNAKELLPSLEKGESKQGVIEKLNYALHSADPAWKTDASAAEYLPIPMGSNVLSLNIQDNTSLTGENAVKLYRMLAKIDVKLTGKAQENFELTSVYLFNYNLIGNMFPKWNNDDPVANIPSQSKVLGPIEYLVPAENKYAFFNSIYLMEAMNNDAAGNALSSDDRTCVVVGGNYNDGKTIKEYFYRADLAKKEGEIVKHFNVYRNHRYDLNIINVGGVGFTTPEEAFKAGPVNIEVSVQPWNDGNITEVLSDGLYSMGISKSEFQFPKDPQNNVILYIYTDYINGLESVKFSDSDTDPNAGLASNWIVKKELTDNGASGMKRYTLKFDVLQNSDIPRTGYIHLQAGRMHMVVRIIQSNRAGSVLLAMNENGDLINGLEFAAAPGVALDPKKFRIEWAPTDETLYITSNTMSNPEGGLYDPILWNSYNTVSGDINETSTDVYLEAIFNDSGEVEFTVEPTPITAADVENDPFYERQIQVNFRATGAEGTMRKNVLLQQYVYNMDATPQDFHLADGSKYYFNVKSNRPWKAYLVDNGNNMVVTPSVNASVPFAQGAYNLPNGTNVEFTTFNDLADPTILMGTAKVRIEWLSGEDINNPAHWTTDNTTELFCASGIIQPLSNSYILNNKIPILIPVKRANGYRNEIDREESWVPSMGSNANQIAGSFNIGLLWSDVQGDNGTGLDQNGSTPIRLLHRAKNGENGYIFIQRGNVEGNVVVAATVNSKVVWSWHIWVTGYAPNVSNIWMDRNLGAMKNYIDPLAKGLHYQWGRKDPFPNSRDWTKKEPAIYNESTTEFTVPAWVNNNTLAYSLANPTTGISDWTGSMGDHTWFFNGKTIYDPCPPGWRVPISGSWEDDVKTTGGTWDHGYNWSLYGGYYPMTFWREAAGINSSNKSGSAWSATVEGSEARRLYYYYDLGKEEDYINEISKQKRHYGFGIRCKAE